MIQLKKLIIDDEDYTEDAVWTLQGQDTLDESFDLIYIELKAIDKNNPFLPFVDVEITINDNGNDIVKTMYLESDSVTEITSLNKYNHNLLFIEETKYLERLFVDKSIRQPLIHNYSELDVKPFVYLDRVNTRAGSDVGNEETNDEIYLFNPIFTKGTTYTFDNPMKMLDLISNRLNLDVGVRSITTFKGAELTIYNNVGSAVSITRATYEGQVFPTWTFEFTPDEEGLYTFEIKGKDGYVYIPWSGENNYFDSTARFDTTCVETVAEKPDYTIKDVIEQLCQTTIILRDDEQPLLSLASVDEYVDRSQEYKDKINTILNSVSPEYTFSKMSMWEALKTIGDSFHFIPRLKNKKIYFDLLGRNDMANIEELGQYYSNTSNQNSNEFCDGLNTQVSNLTCVDDEGEGVVSTPSNNFRTLRTEDGKVQITDSNIIIPTEENIERPIKLEIGYLSDGTFVGDITMFLYRDDEYENLSSYSSAYPTSKMFALKYTQGSKNITGLSFKREHPVSGTFENIAIKNIIFKKLGRSLSWWNNLWENENTFNLQYRFTYIPSVNANINQHKDNVDDMQDKPLYIAYNQGASKVSSNAYGENLKGTIAKLGNTEKSKMYILPSLSLIPQCGTLFDKDYYISTVKYEIYPYFIKCELGLSKNFNKKSAYVEINSQLELFEYNRQNIVDRYAIYEEYCEIGDDRGGDTNSIITDAGLEIFTYSLCGGEIGGNQIKSVVAQGVSSFGNNLTEVVLPCISLGIGNSVLFMFNYVDSISAGNRAYNTSQGRYQRFVKYTDIYGEVDKLKLKYGSCGDIANNYQDAVEIGDSLPSTTKVNIPTQVEDVRYGYKYFDTSSHPIVLKKGVGEIPHISYQLNFIANRPNIIIGSSIATKSIFVNEAVTDYRVCLLKKKLNKFDNKVDLIDAYVYEPLSFGDDVYYNKKQKIVGFDIGELTRFKANDNYVAWAIVNIHNNSNDLIVGENIDIKLNSIVPLPVFKFKRKLHDIRFVNAGLYQNIKFKTRIKEWDNLINEGSIVVENNKLTNSSYNFSGYLKIQDNISSIGYQAFWGKDIDAGLKAVIIPTSVTIIENEAFRYCTKMNNLYLNTGLEKIGNMAFEECDLTEVVIPSSVTQIGYNAFTNNTNLQKVIFEDIYNWYYIESGTKVYLDVSNPTNNANLLKTNSTWLYKEI